MNEDLTVPTTLKDQTSLTKKVFLSGVLLFVIFCVSLFYINMPPSSANGVEVVIPQGSSVSEIATLLEDNKIIRSSLFFTIITRAYLRNETLKAGTYVIEPPQTTITVIEKLREGSSITNDVTYTFPEGFTIKDMPIYTDGWVTDEDAASLAEYEGYLFPDTYAVGQSDTVLNLVERMRNEFNEKILPLTDEIEQSGYTVGELVILASILEREANDETSMRLVAGILQNRLKNDMPLQVDAPFEYLLGKGSSELTLDDLKSDTPYNTYLYKGLPPTPIANPGMMALNAVLSPTPSEYLFYLTGNDGNFYYARTFDEHVRNKERYLR